jgi:hypothetical protein
MLENHHPLRYRGSKLCKTKGSPAQRRGTLKNYRATGIPTNPEAIYVYAPGDHL